MTLSSNFRVKRTRVSMTDANTANRFDKSKQHFKILLDGYSARSADTKLTGS